MYDIKTIDAFYADIIYQLNIIPYTMPPFTINNIASPDEVFTNLWPLRQFPMVIKRIELIAEHPDTGLRATLTLPLYRWRRVTKWRCKTRCRALRFTLLRMASDAGLL